MVSPEDSIGIYKFLLNNGIQVWLLGGWGIDALLGKQTRPHKDLDMILLLDDILKARELLGHEGYGLKELWSENRFAMDAFGNETATAFVLQDPDGREIDVHAIRLDDQGNGFPAWNDDTGFILTRQDLAGQGMVAGLAVQCITPEKQVSCHTGYELPEKQFGDLERLHERFGVGYPDEYLRIRPSGA